MILKNGVVIDGVKTSKARVKVRKIDKTTNTSIVEITIHEGRNHQVKKNVWICWLQSVKT